MAFPLPSLPPETYWPRVELPRKDSVFLRLGLRGRRAVVYGLGVLLALSEGSMSFLEHLDELRKRLIVSIVALIGGMLVAFAFVTQIFDFIMIPLQETLPPGGALIYTEPTEAFFLYIRMAALVGVFIAAPVILWQFWLFIAPGLYAREKKFAIPFVVFSTLFFVSGGLFSHFVAFQWAWKFFGAFSSETVEFLPRIAPVFSLYTRMLLAFGFIFQMPTLAFFLARMGMITPRFLLKNFKYAVLAIFVVAAVLTPSPDPFNQFLMAGPMLVLYGLSILIAWLFGTAQDD